MTLPSPPLLLITDRQHAQGDVTDIAELAFTAGCRWISLREKDLPPPEQRTLLRALLDRAHRHNAVVTLHGDPALAREAGVQGVHLAAGSDTAAARRLLGTDALIGLSIHSEAEARSADPALVDYVIAGPVFETASKPGYGPALGPQGLEMIVQASRVPVIAIGGVAANNVPDCLAASAAGIAVMGGVMRAENPAAIVTQLLGALAASQPRPR